MAGISMYTLWMCPFKHRKGLDLLNTISLPIGRLKRWSCEVLNPSKLLMWTEKLHFQGEGVIWGDKSEVQNILPGSARNVSIWGKGWIGVHKSEVKKLKPAPSPVNHMVCIWGKMQIFDHFSPHSASALDHSQCPLLRLTMGITTKTQWNSQVDSLSIMNRRSCQSVLT